MTTAIKIYGVPEAIGAFDELPRRVQFRHLRIALNAGGGIISKRYAALAHRQTGLLAKSIGVKVKIPDASFNARHHGKPAYASIGVKRRAGRIMRINKQGKLKGFGIAQKLLKSERARLQKEGTLPPLQRERAAVKVVLDKHQDAVFRSPSRYAHLAGPQRKGAEILAAAVSQTKNQAAAKVIEKLQQGLESEARSLAR